MIIYRKNICDLMFQNVKAISTIQYHKCVVNNMKIYLLLMYIRKYSY